MSQESGATSPSVVPLGPFPGVSWGSRPPLVLRYSDAAVLRRIQWLNRPLVESRPFFFPPLFFSGVLKIKHIFTNHEGPTLFPFSSWFPVSDASSVLADTTPVLSSPWLAVLLSCFPPLFFDRLPPE